MAQFRVYKNTNELSIPTHPYLLDIQYKIVSRLDTRLIVPLVNDIMVMAKVHLEFEIEGKMMIMSTTEMASVPLSMLGQEVADLSSESREIMNVIDFLITGF